MRSERSDEIFASVSPSASLSTTNPTTIAIEQALATLNVLIEAAAHFLLEGSDQLLNSDNITHNHMIKITLNQCYFRHLQMFHDDTGIPVNQLAPNDEIEGQILGYSAAQHKNLAGLINKRYFADVEAKADREKVGKQKTISALSDYTWTTIPKAHRA